MRDAWVIGLLVSFIAPLANSAPAQCKFSQFAELPVSMSRSRPIVTGTINGVPARFIADSGAFFSTLSSESAKRFKLPVTDPPYGIQVTGIGGVEKTMLATVKDFELVGLNGGPLHQVEFLTISHAFSDDADGLLGQNVLAFADTEFDLANGIIRLLRSKGCDGDSYVYWSKSQPYGVLEISTTTRLQPHVLADAKLNGVKIRLLFDTGGSTSVLTRRAAARAGVRPEDVGVAAGPVSTGIGKRKVETWIAPFKSLELGGEQINNFRLRIGDFTTLLGVDLIIGTDFFLSHRIYVANSQHKLFFTYNGGPVFDLTVHSQADQAPPAVRDGAAAAEPAEFGSDQPTDATGFRRRGAAFVARRDFANAIADYDRAIELDGADPDTYYQRAIARVNNRQPVLAMGDIDEALRLKPDHIQALLLRGELRLFSRDERGARTDFDRAAGLAPDDPGLGLRIAQAYSSNSRYEQAVGQLDRWISAHPHDERMPLALNNRCWARASQGVELNLALLDCDNALKSGPRYSSVLDSRGLVRLRMGDFERAISDYKASLELQPKNAFSLYGLGLAEIRKGASADGDRDVQAAIAIRPTIADEFKRIGLAP